MRDFDVLLTPDFARDVAKLGELDQNAKDLDRLAWWKHIIQDYSVFTPLFNTTASPRSCVRTHARRGAGIQVPWPGCR